MSRVIVITGAGIGLGRALARRFAADGEKIVLLGRSLDKLEAVAAELGAGTLALACDVSSPESVKAAFATIAQHHPRIDVLINNAAFFQPFLVAEASDEQIVSTIGTNLTGTILCSRSAIPLMGPGGHILNLSSESVDLPFPHLALYQCSKAGIEKFSQILYRELEPNGILVTCVRAGQMMEEGKKWDADPAAQMRFAQAAMQAGLNLRERPISQFTSVAEFFRHLVNMPADLHAEMVTLHGRRPVNH